jgi:hypothetical protein
MNFEEIQIEAATSPRDVCYEGKVSAVLVSLYIYLFLLSHMLGSVKMQFSLEIPVSIKYRSSICKN